MKPRIYDAIMVAAFFVYIAACWCFGRWLLERLEVEHQRKMGRLLPVSTEREVIFDGTEIEVEMVEVIIDDRRNKCAPY